MMDKKFSIKLEEAPMTIVAAIKENDNSILLAADGGAIDMSINVRFDHVPKLYCHPKAMLAPDFPT